MTGEGPSAGGAIPPPTGRRQELITLWAIGAAIAGLALVVIGTVLLLASYAEVEKQSTLAETEAIARGAAAFIEARATGQLHVLRSYAARPRLRASMAHGDAKEAAAHLRELQQSYPEMDRVFVMDRVGLVWAAHPAASRLAGMDFSDRDWYQAVRRDAAPYVSAVSTAARDGAPEVIMALPIRDDVGRLIGILGSAQRLEVIRSWLSSITVPAGDLYVVDRQGQLVFHRTLTGPEHLRDYADAPEVRRLLRAEQGITDNGDATDREMRLTAFRVLPALGWGLVVYRHRDLVLYRVHALLRRAAAIGIGLMLAVMGLGIISLRSRWRILSLVDQLRAKAAELEAAQVELVRKERLAILGQLAGGVSHELRNPLGVISNSAFFLKMVLPGDDRAKKHLAIIEREIGTATQIVTDLLDFARVRPPAQTPADLNALARETLDRVSLPERVCVSLALDDALPPLRVDAEQIHLVLGNLVRNAEQAMPDGGTLTVETGADRGSVWIAVADTGSGIEPTIVARIFEPLFTTKARGIGLGLAIARALVEQNGGTIAVETAPGKGSRFLLRFGGPPPDA